MVGTLSTPEELAHWLINGEVGTDPTPDVLAAAAERIYHQLRAGLLGFLGATGFDSLWAHAMYLAFGTALPPGTHHAAAPTVTLPPGVPAVVLERDIVVARAVLSLTFATAFALLFTLLGAPLGVRLLQQVWPAFQERASSSQTGDRPL